MDPVYGKLGNIAFEQAIHAGSLYALATASPEDKVFAPGVDSDQRLHHVIVGQQVHLRCPVSRKYSDCR